MEYFLPKLLESYNIFWLCGCDQSKIVWNVNMLVWGNLNCTFLDFKGPAHPNSTISTVSEEGAVFYLKPLKKLMECPKNFTKIRTQN